MLLWVLIVALFGAMAAWFGGNLPPSLRARVFAVQGAIGLAFLAFILFTSNPFLRLAVPPFDGQDLNPLLQNLGLAFHPPFFNMAFTPFMVLLGLIMRVGAMMPCKRASLTKAMRPLRYAFVLAIACAGLAWAMQSGRSLIGPMGAFLGAWLVMGAAIDLASRTAIHSTRHA